MNYITFTCFFIYKIHNIIIYILQFEQSLIFLMINILQILQVV